ncbi:MAG TPA: serine/threonine-protein kinase [Anaeromyxobacteraceae bacterium]|nr:serine/threonine-protein kinase [Anaeromyxobacteraceae bacterium]
MAATSPITPEFKPHSFGKFFLLQRLAVGGMAEIYRARVVGAAGFEKELVVKRILPARAQDQGFISMLVNEAKLTVQLTHNNVAQIYECGSIDGNFFISMELVNGVSMKEVMHAFAQAGTAFNPEQAIFMVLQLLQGLDYAHKKTDAQGHPLQIVHCDVSPDNALVSFEGEVKLLDFGIARAATGLSNYKEGMLMGKLGYVAPEQASLETRWDHRVDVFAAGIILYELLTRQKPFPTATDVESLVASRKAKVVPPTTLDPRLPKEIDQIVARALAYDPARRYPDARTFADALVDILFPTPQSAVQDLVAKQMHQVFAEKIARQRQARAHDALVMKVLANIADRPREELTPGGGLAVTPARGLPAAPAEPSGELGTTGEISGTGRRAAARPSRRPVVVRKGVPFSLTFLLLLLFAAGGAAAAGFGAPWLRHGVIVVTSEPPGADVALDGAPTGQRTPAVLDEVVLASPHEVTLSGPSLRELTLPVRPEPGRLAVRVHARVGTALGALTVQSEPPGAEVRLDDRAVGATPLTIPDVRLDERHRIDLSLPGHEIDQFVVLPEKDGRTFLRRLVAAAPAPAPAARKGK